MQKRAWVLLVISFFLLAVTVLIWWAGRKPNDAAMALVFIGYTNQFVAPADIPGIKLVPMPGHIVAVLHATNTGSVPVKLNAAWRPPAAMNGFVRPSGAPRLLKPGESVLVYVAVDPGQGPWWTEYMYQRRGLRDRLVGRAWNSGNRTIQSWIGPLISDLYSVTCGPITNQPPDAFRRPPYVFSRQRFHEPPDPFLKFIEPRPSVRFFQPSMEDLLIETNTPVRKPTGGL